MSHWKRFLGILAPAAWMLFVVGTTEASDNLAYLYTNTNQFGMIDLNTGDFTQFGTTSQSLGSIGVVNGEIYGCALESTALYKVSPINGSLTLVGNSSVSFYVLGSTMTTLYAIDINGNLYSVNPSTAAVTLIGATGQGGEGHGVSLSTNADSLYMTVDTKLYSVNTVTGSATALGATGVNDIGSLIYLNGLLYAGVTQPTSQVYTLNTSTGAGTPVSTPSGNPAPSKLWGLVPASPVVSDLNLITTRAAMCGNDLFTWDQLPPPVSTVKTPVTVISTNGISSTLTANGTSVFTDQQEPGLWNGNFAPGDYLIGTGQTVASGPLQITFPAPVWGVGAQMGYGTNGSFLAGISVFGAGGVPLGSYEVSGTESSNGDNSAPFIGVLDDQGRITEVQLYTLSSFGSSPGSFAINEVSLNTTGSKLATTAGSPQSAVVNTAFATPLTVTLTDPCNAPLSGATVDFMAPVSGASATLSESSAVTGSSGMASITATANGTAGVYSLTASAFGLSSTFALTNVALASVSVPPSINGSESGSGQVTLTSGAPASGAVITLTSSNPTILSVPALVTVGSGATTAPFTFTTNASNVATNVTITASDGTNKQTATITVRPALLAAVKLPHTTVVGGNSSTDNQVTLTGGAPQGGAEVSLTSSDPAVATVPASVTIPAGKNSAIFNIGTSGVGSAQTITISATYNGVTKTATLTVQPAQLESLTLSPTQITGGKSSTHNTLRLTGQPPAGGTAITLTSGNAAVASVPPNVSVAAGATTATFTIQTTVVNSNTVVPITATLGSVMKSANLTVTPK